MLSRGKFGVGGFWTLGFNKVSVLSLPLAFRLCLFAFTVARRSRKDVYCVPVCSREVLRV